LPLRWGEPPAMITQLIILIALVIFVFADTAADHRG
jgi:hypothetical protein